MIKKNWLAGFCFVVIACGFFMIGGCEKDKEEKNQKDVTIDKKQVKEKVVQTKVFTQYEPIPYRFGRFQIEHGGDY